MPFPVHSLDSAPEESRSSMIAMEREFGAIPVPIAKMATSPELLNGFLEATHAFDRTTLPPIAREVMIMTVAVRNGCHTCVGLHAAALRRLGAAELVDPLRHDQALQDQQLDAIRVFTHRLMDRTGAVEDSDLTAFLDAGYTEQNALEVVYGIGAYTMSTFANRLIGA
ncbi:carboxymuconolactone decarboxylase family protein [Microlunatus elymi]|uniref:Carboxymuconolactone decarboxylase family protein n=1 Tax=Microlunatus elymi TaxID=2596828 RepID=A0A516Q385_9ACTN|nr:carboxymuconolactone decarboxylase family protein [Microlunatus elymi]QDP97890.1 carboxymuconolactone decarboxylase family protein [Microlunatus elymi]